MIDSTSFVTYCAVVLGFVFIPGPATLLTIARATTSGTRVGIATGAGITAGDVCHTTFAAVGISAIIATSAFFFNAVKYAGAAYLIYLGIKAILEKASTSLGRERVTITATTAFRQAILMEVMNPKTALFFLAFLPQFVQPAKGPIVMQLIVLGTAFAALGFLSTIVFATMAGRLGKFLHRHPLVMKKQGKVVGGIYCALGLRIAMQQR